MKDSKKIESKKKRCAECKISKSLKYFPLKKKGGTEHYEYCKRCSRLKNRISYEKNKAKVIARTSANNKRKGWLYQRAYVVKNLASSKYNSLKHRCRRDKVKLMSRKSFIKWFDAQEKICTYCGIEMKTRISLDRMNPMLGYVGGNITLACVKCNIIKNNVFTVEEMKEIADKYIKPKLKLESQPEELNVPNPSIFDKKPTGEFTTEIVKGTPEKQVIYTSEGDAVGEVEKKCNYRCECNCKKCGE